MIKKWNRDGLYLYKSSKHSLSTKLRVNHKKRGKHPLSFPFTKIILFNSYFAHKINPRNMASPSFGAMFVTFGQVVEEEKERIGLQRPIVFNQDVSSTIHGPLPSKRAKCPSSPPNPSPRWCQAPKRWHFASFKEVVWHVGGGQGPPRCPLSLQRACHRHPECGPLASNLWASSPMEAQTRLVLPKLSTN